MLDCFTTGGSLREAQNPRRTANRTASYEARCKWSSAQPILRPALKRRKGSEKLACASLHAFPTPTPQSPCLAEITKLKVELVMSKSST